MRQETGSNITTESKDVISVRVAMNGDAFVLPEVHISANASDSSNRALYVELISKRAMLMPAEILPSDPAESAEFCRREYSSGGMTIYDSEELLILGRDSSEGHLALVTLPTIIIEELRRRGNRELIYDSPLLRERMSSSPHVIVDVVDGLSVIKVYSDDDLQFADVFETSNSDQVIYWAKNLSEAMLLNGYDLFFIRGGEPSIISSLRPFFRNITCD